MLATNVDYAIRSKVNKRFSWNNAGPVGKVSIVIDKSDYELRNMLYTATLYKRGPIAMRYPRGNALGVETGDFEKMEIGKGEIVKEGKDIAIIALGNMVKNSVDAALECF